MSFGIFAPSPPHSLVLSAVAGAVGGTIDLSCSDGSTVGITQRQLQRGDTLVGPWTTIATLTGSTTFQDTGRPAGTTQYYRYLCTDRLGRTTTSAVFTGAASNPGAGQKRWNPTVYIRPDAQGYGTKDAQRRATYRAVLPYSHIGVEIPTCWGRINAVEGVYDFSTLVADYNVATANGTNGKPILVALTFQNYGAPTPTSSQNLSTDPVMVPNWVVAGRSGTPGWVWRDSGAGSSGVMPRLCESWVMDGLIACAQALIDYCDANLPLVQAVIVGETSSAYANVAGAGWSSSAYDTQWQRMPAAIGGRSSNVWGGISHNGLGTAQGSKDMTALIVANNCMQGVEDAVGWYSDTWPMPDTDDARGGWGFLAMQGAGLRSGFNWGTTDSRLLVPQRPENQAIRSPGIGLSLILSHINSHWKGTHPVFVLYMDDDGAGGYTSYTPSDYSGTVSVPAQSGTNVRAFLADTSNAVTRTAYPTP